MTAKKRHSYPPKTIVFHGTPVEFKRVNPDFPSALYYYHEPTGYQPLYPSVYSIDLWNAGGFVKSWDFFAEEYLENRQLITYRQYSLYNYIVQLRNRGYYLSIKGSRIAEKRDDDGNLIREGKEVKGLSAVTGIRRPELIADLDRLEDVLLLHRVRRLDLQGIPTELVVHSPRTARELDKDGWHDFIAKRIAADATRGRRRSAMISGEKNGQPFSYLDRRSRSAGFQFDYRAVRDAFGDRCHQFANFALTYFKKNYHFLTENKAGFESDYREKLALELNLWNIAGNERRKNCYAAAHAFRTIYCPPIEEIIA